MWVQLTRLVFRMSRLKYVSRVVRGDGRDGFIVQYKGRQRTGLLKKGAAETFVRDLLVKEGEIEPTDPAPLKARYRKKAKVHINNKRPRK